MNRRMIKNALGLLVAVAGLTSMQAQADVIAFYDFNDTGDHATDSAGYAAGTASAISVGAGLNFITDNSSIAHNYDGVTDQYSLGGTPIAFGYNVGTNPNFSSAYSAGTYIEFSVTADQGSEIDLGELSWVHRRAHSTRDLDSWMMVYSKNAAVDFADATLTAAQAVGSGSIAGGSYLPQSVDLRSQDILQVGETGTFRLYAYGRSATSTSTTGTLFDDFKLLPEPPVSVLATATNQVSAPFDVDVSFSMAVTGLEASDFVVSNGVVTAASLTGSGDAYSVEITPALSGYVSVLLSAGAVAGNGSTNVASDPLTVFYLAPGSEHPTALLSTGSSTVTSSFTVDVVFNEPVSGLALSDFVIDNGSLANLTGAGAAYSVAVTPTLRGLVTISLPEGAVTDLDGDNLWNLGSDELVTACAKPPSVVISGSHITVDANDLSPATGGDNSDTFDGSDGDSFATTLYVRGSEASAEYRVTSRLKFDLSALDAAPVKAVILHLNGYSINNTNSVHLEAVAAATDGFSSPSYALATLGIPADGGDVKYAENTPRSYTLDVTEMVSAWMDGSWANHGMLLRLANDSVNNGVGFQLSGEDAPRLEVIWAEVSPVPAQSRNYSYLYFENGYPTRLSPGARRGSEQNTVARANPDLVFQTGYYSLMLDCNDMQLKGYDPLAGSDYRSALDEDVTVFTPATDFLLSVTRGGVEYTCTSAVVQDSAGDYVRMIESGQYLKRIDHLGLVFRDANGYKLWVANDCRLEVSAWPDRVTFMLDFSSETANPITQTSIQLVSPIGATHRVDESGSRARLTLRPQDDTMLPAMSRGNYITQATLTNGSALAVRFDADVHAFHIDVPANKVKYPSGKNRVDEYLFEVTNPSATTENIPLVFDQPTARAITGTVMLLCDADDGRPLGIPVQISKNWHNNVSTVHMGEWLRGSTMLTLEPGESRRFKLRVIYGYWGGAGTVSHAQLSLIGWNCNWKWDESALGAWGESMTYDPTMHAGAAFMCDVRPAFTTSFNSTSPYADRSSTTTYNWTENVGGGDFLIYHDQSNVYRWVKRLKTCYHQTGPNLTEVFYGGVTDDNKIRVTYTSRAVSTLDYHRRFHDYKYEFLQDVVSPQRLVFHQMAADYYNRQRFTNYYIGDATGVLLQKAMDGGGDRYKGSRIPFDGKWLSIDDVTGDETSRTARALRGIIPLSSTLNGAAFPLYLRTYGRTYGDRTMLFDLTADFVSRSYSAGDVVAGEVEFILPPQHINHYWGTDWEFRNRLTAYGDTAWEPVRDEMKHNTQMDVMAHHGELLRNYPVTVQPVGNRVLADFSISSGGIGHVPVVLERAPAGLALKAQRWNGSEWVDLESVNLAANSYYQGRLNADGTMNYTFSIPRPSSDLNAAWRVRVVSDLADGNTYEEWTSQYGLEGTDVVRSADPDGDSHVNLAEYAFGGNPLASEDTGHAPEWFLSDETSDTGVEFMNYVYTRRRDAADWGLHYTVEGRASLQSGNWLTNGIVEEDAVEIDSNFEAVTNRVAISGASGFVRCRVESTP